MFAGATREVVFSNPDVVRRINDEFIPVALKAAHVNNPPRVRGKLTAEGKLYAEIGRTKPAPQGICTANSDGKVLSWALSFDDNKSILKFLDHVQNRYRESSDASKPVTAERYRKFPSIALADVADTRERLDVPDRHETPCPGKPIFSAGTLTGKIIGRALDANGKPVADTLRQENYMEAAAHFDVNLQQELLDVASKADGKRFRIPRRFAEAIVGPAYLGQLDVNPLGTVPGSKNDFRAIDFWGELVPGAKAKTFLITGMTDVEGGQDSRGVSRGDGRIWEHRVSLAWRGHIEVMDGRISQLSLIAVGNEKLRWGNSMLFVSREADVEHLMAGHPIDLECGVRYGVWATAVE